MQVASANSIAATTSKSAEIAAMRRDAGTRASSPAPIQAEIIPPAIMDRTTSVKAEMSVLGRIPRRVTAANARVTRLTRRLNRTALCG